MSDNRFGRKSFLCLTGGKIAKEVRDLPNRFLAPEFELLLAILDRAIKDATSITSDNAIRRDAMKWFNSRSMEPWSYLWVCQILCLTDTLTIRIRRKVNLD